LTGWKCRRMEMGNVTTQGKPVPRHEDVRVVNCPQPSAPLSPFKEKNVTTEDVVAVADQFQANLKPCSSVIPADDAVECRNNVNVLASSVRDILTGSDDDDDLRVLAEIEAFNAANSDATLDCEALMEILAAESQQEFQREIHAVQEDLRQGIVAATGQEYDDELVQVLRLSAHTFEQERRFHFYADLSERALFALESFNKEPPPKRSRTCTDVANTLLEQGFTMEQVGLAMQHCSTVETAVDWILEHDPHDPGQRDGETCTS